MRTNKETLKVFFLILIVLLQLLSSCSRNIKKDELKKEILEIHNNLIKAHLENNPDFFIQHLSDNFVSVKNGDILKPTLDEIQVNMSNYINNTTFHEYKDLQEPIIGLSDDGTMAWAIVQVLVQGDRKLEDGTIRKIDFTCAWLTLYQRSGKEWNVLAEVSTFK